MFVKLVNELFVICIDEAAELGMGGQSESSERYVHKVYGRIVGRVAGCHRHV